MIESVNKRAFTGGQMRITSEEIAQLANVSRSTVSRVINNYPNVPEETRQKVMAVIKEKGYEPNSFARVLAGKCNMEIALCISDYNNGKKRWRGMDSPYFMRLIAELISQGKEYGYVISIFVVSEPSDYVKIENMFLNRQITGGIFIGFEFQMDKVNEMIARGFNMAVIDPAENMVEADNVKGIYSENEEGAYLATSYLLKNGHQRIGHLRGDSRLSGRDRERGYLRAMEEAGCKDAGALVEMGEYDRDKAYQATIRLINEKKVTAIFAANDAMAVAAMQAASELGYKVPEDIAVMGCDYVSLFEEVGIHLTTIEISLREIADASIKAVLDIDKQKKIVCKAKIRKGLTA